MSLIWGMKPRIKAWNITSGVTQSLCDLMSWLQAVMAQKRKKKLYNPVHLFSFINNPALTFCSTDSCHMQNVIPHIFNGFNSVPNILKAETGRWSGDLLRIWCVFVCENNRAWRFSVVSFVLVHVPVSAVVTQWVWSHCFKHKLFRRTKSKASVAGQKKRNH